MSELNAINAYQLTINIEDSEVYIHNDEFGCGGSLVECYLKSEADKVIAELKSDIADLRDDKKLTDAILDERNAENKRLKEVLKRHGITLLKED
jgi:hypothetical protein